MCGRQFFSRWWFQIFFLCSSLFAENSHFDEHIFQMGWFNHQPVLYLLQGPYNFEHLLWQVSVAMNDMNDASGGWDSWARQLQAGPHERPEERAEFCCLGYIGDEKLPIYVGIIS